MKNREIKVIGFGRFVKTNKPRRKIGLDTNICLCWFENQKILENYCPNIVRREDSLYINYKVFGELLYLISNKNKLSKEIVKKDLFNFLRRNNINIIKSFEIDKEKFNEVILLLRKNRFKFKNNPDDGDLEIIAIFYASKMDCIFSDNYKHFEGPCSFLKISYERPFEVEIGSEQDVRKMLKDFNFKKRR